MNFRTYIHDKQLIFMNIVLVLLTVFTTLLVLLRVDVTQSIAIIRNNTTLGLSGFEKADTKSLYLFIVITLLVTVFHTVFSMRIRPQARTVSFIAIGLGIVAQVFLLVVSSAILSLHR